MKTDFVHLIIDGTNFQAKFDSLLEIPLFDAFFQQYDKENLTIVYLDRDYDLFEQLYTSILYDDETKTELSDKAKYEFEYYGITENDENNNEISNKIEFEVDNLNERPFYVNACGHIFQTTKKRLQTNEYFRCMFLEERWIESSSDAGTQDNPVFINIPYKAFRYILNYLRNPWNQIPIEYIQITKMLLINNPHILKYSYIQKNTPAIKLNTKRKNICYGELKNKEFINNNNSTSIATGSGSALKIIANNCKKDFESRLSNQVITFFQHNKYKTTNTSKTMFSVRSLNNISWGGMCKFHIPRMAEVIHSGYFKIIIEHKHRINWKPQFFYRIFKNIRFCLDNKVVDEVYGNVLWQEELLYEDADMKYILDMIEFHDTNTSFYIPLRFFFMHHTSTALPLFMAMYSSADILLEISNFCDCSIDVLTSDPELQIELKLNMHFFDQVERHNIFSMPWSNTIHQHQYFEFENDPLKTKCSLSLDLNGSIELLSFTLHTDKKDLFWCGYNDEDVDPLISAKFSINGTTLFNHDATYLKVLDKKESTLNIPHIPIYTYSFGLFLKESMYNGQASGTLNTSVLNDIVLELHMKPGVQRICLWTIKKNTLVLKNGGAYIEFDNS